MSIYLTLVLTLTLILIMALTLADNLIPTLIHDVCSPAIADDKREEFQRRTGLSLLQ